MRISNVCQARNILVGVVIEVMMTYVVNYG